MCTAQWRITLAVWVLIFSVIKRAQRPALRAGFSEPGWKRKAVAIAIKSDSCLLGWDVIREQAMLSDFVFGICLLWGLGFGFTHFQWKRCCRAAASDLQWGLCQANHSCTASSSAESLLVLRFPSGGVKHSASVQAAPPGFSLQECLDRGVWGAVVSLVP